MTSLRTGKCLLPCQRNEIVDSLATLIMVHTTHPSSVQLEKIATKFIEVYPSAADQVPGGKPYVSGWLMNC